MRYLTYFVSDNCRIDIHNGLLSGQEKIYHNGNLVAAKFSVLGSRHRFKVMEDDADTEYVVVISYKYLLRINCDIFRNGKALLLS